MVQSGLQVQMSASSTPSKACHLHVHRDHKSLALQAFILRLPCDPYLALLYKASQGACIIQITASPSTDLQHMLYRWRATGASCPTRPRP